METQKNATLAPDGVTKTKHKSPLSRDKWYGFLFISPMVIGYILFVLSPIIATFYMSLTDWSLINESSFIGFKNYVDLFTKDKTFYDTAINTLYFTICLVPLI